MSNQEVMGQIAHRLSILNAKISKGEIPQKAISKELESIRNLATKNNVPLVVDDKDYTGSAHSSENKSDQEVNSYDDSEESSYEPPITIPETSYEETEEFESSYEESDSYSY